MGSSRSPETIEICAVGWPIGVTLRPLPCPSLPCRPLAYGVREPGGAGPATPAGASRKVWGVVTVRGLQGQPMYRAPRGRAPTGHQ